MVPIYLADDMVLPSPRTDGRHRRLFNLNRGLLIVRSILALLAGSAALVVCLLLAVLLWLDAFPVTAWGLAGLLGVELIAGLAGAAVVSWLAPRAPAAHGWLFGVLVFILNVWTLLEPGTPWPLIPGLLLLGLVPLQTWIGVTIGVHFRKTDPAR
jgi:hypothetical protein